MKLNRSYVVNAIETQGRYYSGNGKEFVPSYQIEYSRNGGLSWHKWKDFHGSSVSKTPFLFSILNHDSSAASCIDI